MVDNLKNELWLARVNLIDPAAHLVPDDIGHALMHGPSYDCETEAQFSQWHHDTIETEETNQDVDNGEPKFIQKWNAW